MNNPKYVKLRANYNRRLMVLYNLYVNKNNRININDNKYIYLQKHIYLSFFGRTMLLEKVYNIISYIFSNENVLYLGLDINHKTFRSLKKRFINSDDYTFIKLSWIL